MTYKYNLRTGSELKAKKKEIGKQNWSHFKSLIDLN